jgi:hypothetical protein
MEGMLVPVSCIENYDKNKTYEILFISDDNNFDEYGLDFQKILLVDEEYIFVFDSKPYLDNKYFIIVEYIES